MCSITLGIVPFFFFSFLSVLDGDLLDNKHNIYKAQQTKLGGDPLHNTNTWTEEYTQKEKTFPTYIQLYTAHHGQWIRSLSNPCKQDPKHVYRDLLTPSGSQQSVFVPRSYHLQPQILSSLPPVKYPIYTPCYLAHTISSHYPPSIQAMVSHKGHTAFISSSSSFSFSHAWFSHQ